jgi:hypothetical protein
MPLPCISTRSSLHRIRTRLTRRPKRDKQSPIAKDAPAVIFRPSTPVTSSREPRDSHLPKKSAAAFAVLRVSVATDPGLALAARKGTGYYKAPSLKSVWYRGRYLHDGSVASPENMFDPERLKRITFARWLATAWYNNTRQTVSYFRTPAAALRARAAD